MTHFFRRPQRLSLAIFSVTALVGLSSLACQPPPEKKAEKPAETETSKDAQKSKAERNKAMAKKVTPSKPNAIPAPDDVAAAPADAKATPSGLKYKVLKAGTGTVKPVAADKVKVHYTGWTTDGKMFDSSVSRGRPATFGLSQVIKGWTEGLQLMVEGEKTRFWIPGNLAYGDRPTRPGAPAGTLVFDVELLSIVKPIPAPADVAAPPADAKKTDSGLAYKTLSAGSGANPTEADTVEVHYTGWTTDGKMFDSSVMRGQTATFPLRGVIKGWTEGVQLMKVGEKARFWIPGGLAYGDKPTRPGAPAGMLVFDIELVAIKGK
jgi:FKBP-type peptidyl-prolyl cis-trans isomerase